MISVNEINELIGKYYSREIAEKEEVKNMLIQKGISVEDIVNALNAAMQNKNYRELSRIFFAIALTRLYSPEYLSALRKLLKEQWHKSHEEIMLILQFDIYDPDCVDDVAEAMHIKFEDMFPEDLDAFIRKGAYVLAGIDTEYAKNKLEELANDENPIIRKYCSYQVKKLRGEDVYENEEE